MKYQLSKIWSWVFLFYFILIELRTMVPIKSGQHRGCSKLTLGASLCKYRDIIHFLNQSGKHTIGVYLIHSCPFPQFFKSKVADKFLCPFVNLSFFKIKKVTQNYVFKTCCTSKGIFCFLTLVYAIEGLSTIWNEAIGSIGWMQKKYDKVSAINMPASVYL